GLGWLGRGRARPQLGMLLADPAQHSGWRRTDEPGDLPDADIVEIHVDGPGLDLGAEARRPVGHVASAVSALVALRPVLAAAPAQIAALTPRTDHANPPGKSPLNRRRIHSRSAVNTAPQGGGEYDARLRRLPPPSGEGWGGLLPSLFAIRYSLFAIRYSLFRLPLQAVDLVLQVADEVVELGQAWAREARGGEDGADGLGRFPEILVDEDVVVFAEMLHLDAGVLQPATDGIRTVLGAALEAGPQFADRGRQDEHRHHVGTALFIELQRALEVDIEQDVVAGGQVLLHMGPRRAVEIAVHLGRFEQFPVGA